MAKLPVKIIFGLTLLFLLAVAVFVWNEARKEIVFLCRNFEKGVTEQSVRRQLDTGNFLRYRTENLTSGKRLLVDSPYNLSMYKCIIDFDTSGVVKGSRLE